METTTTIFGKHAVREALSRRPDVVLRVFFGDELRGDSIHALATSASIPVRPFVRAELPKDMPHDAVHQGAVAEINVVKLVQDLDTFLGKLAITSHTALIILGELQDPQNIGAIIRSAAAFGVCGILVPEHRQTQINGTIIKVSAGTAFQVPLISIGNVNHAVRTLKDHGFWVYGLDGHAETPLHAEGFERPSVFIVGNEGSGIREKTLELCDIPLRIPMDPDTESLNAGAAVAVTLYAWSVKHPEALHSRDKRV